VRNLSKKTVELYAQAAAPRRHTIRLAVVLALYGANLPAIAEDAGPDQLQELVVTATRREQTVETVPYSISAITGESLKAAGVTDLVDFAREIPSFSIVDLGTRYLSSEIPTIRGINASNIFQGTQQLSQSPVGVYIGNSPISGYFA
jgi:outer membrane receptor protein involved in Fe transport